jgi:hypothetical protein
MLGFNDTVPDEKALSMKSLCHPSMLDSMSTKTGIHGKQTGTCPLSFVASQPHPQSVPEATNDGQSSSLFTQRLGIITVYSLAILLATGYIPGFSL